MPAVNKVKPVKHN